MTIRFKGGSGSGNFGHGGRPGEVGGSVGSAGGISANGAYNITQASGFVSHEPVNLTKTTLSNAIGWTSSRYNDLNKTQVMKQADEILRGTRIEPEWKSTYTEDPNRHMVGTMSPLGGNERVAVQIDVRTFSCGVFVNPAGSQMGGDYLVSRVGEFISRGNFGENWNDFIEEERFNFLVVEM